MEEEIIKKVFVSVEGITITIEGEADSDVTLPVILSEFENALLAWGYRFKGNIEVVELEDK